jgi:putative FmdB family regulatory protein
MPTYGYRCGSCGPFTRMLPLSATTDATTCPRCRAESQRVFAAPALLGGSTPGNRARAAAERSAAEPAVARRSRPVPGARLPGKAAGLPRP